jgi:Zn-dependent protease with chaperone function
MIPSITSALKKTKIAGIILAILAIGVWCIPPMHWGYCLFLSIVFGFFAILALYLVWKTNKARKYLAKLTAEVEEHMLQLFSEIKDTNEDNI